MVSVEDLGRGLLFLIAEFKSENSEGVVLKCLIFTYSLLGILRYFFRPNTDENNKVS